MGTWLGMPGMQLRSRARFKINHRDQPPLDLGINYVRD